MSQITWRWGFFDRLPLWRVMTASSGGNLLVLGKGKESVVDGDTLTFSYTVTSS